MRADVFQVVALCCNADSYLSGEIGRAPEFLAHSTFSSIHEVAFERAGQISSGVLADAVAPWLRRLQKESVSRLRVDLSACPLDPLTPGREAWGLISDGDVGVEIWQPVWRKRLRSHSDPAPWCVRYTATRTGRWTINVPIDLNDARSDLEGVLHEVRDTHPMVAKLGGHGHPPFADLFPADWPQALRTVGFLASRVAFLLRSDEWAEVAIKREMAPTEHDEISQKLWRSAIRALEAASDPVEAAAARSKTQNLRRTA